MSQSNGLTFSNVSKAVMLREELYKVQEAVKALADKMHPLLQAQLDAHNAAWAAAEEAEARQEAQFVAARQEMQSYLNRALEQMTTPRAWE